MSRWKVNITCPRCQHRGDVEEDFPCSHEPVIAALVEALVALLDRLASATCAGIDKDGGWPELAKARAALALAKGDGT